MPFEAVSVLGVRVDCVRETDVIATARAHLESSEPMQIVTVNAEFVMKAQRDGAFAQVLARADIATPDGAGVVWAARRQGAGIERRVGGSDLIQSLSRLAAIEGYRVFLLGAADGVAALAAQRLQADVPNLLVAGTHSGSPSREEEESIVDLVRSSRADLLFVAFGAPQQDLWIARNLTRSGALIGMGVGGSFDYLAGRARRAPLWMQEHGLDWLWRLVRQPWRWRRMLALPWFVWAVWRASPSGRKH